MNPNETIKQEQERHAKYLQLNLSDDFLFRHCMADKEVLKPILEELWEKEIDELVEVIQNAHIQPNNDRPSIHCDIYARDEKDNLYILEMQQRRQKHLLRRSEYYQAISVFDEYLLERAGTEREAYAAIPRCYIVFLCCFDVAKVYPELNFPEFEYTRGVVYGEETKRFINLKEYNRVENPKLRELFQFILKSETAYLHSSWYVVELLQEKVARMRGSEDMERQYLMNEAERREFLFEGRKEGIQIGEKRGRETEKENVILRMFEQHFPISMIAGIVDLSTDAVQRIIEEQQIA